MPQASKSSQTHGQWKTYHPGKASYAGRRSNDEWQQYRDLLTTLHEEGVSRREMRKLLAQHGFEVTPGQLTRRMKYWMLMARDRGNDSVEQSAQRNAPDPGLQYDLGHGQEIPESIEPVQHVLDLYQAYPATQIDTGDYSPQTRPKDMIVTHQILNGFSPQLSLPSSNIRSTRVLQYPHNPTTSVHIDPDSVESFSMIPKHENAGSSDHFGENPFTPKDIKANHSETSGITIYDQEIPFWSKQKLKAMESDHKIPASQCCCFAFFEGDLPTDIYRTYFQHSCKRRTLGMALALLNLNMKRPGQELLKMLNGVMMNQAPRNADTLQRTLMVANPLETIIHRAWQTLSEEAEVESGGLEADGDSPLDTRFRLQIYGGYNCFSVGSEPEYAKMDNRHANLRSSVRKYGSVFNTWFESLKSYLLDVAVYESSEILSKPSTRFTFCFHKLDVFDLARKITSLMGLDCLSSMLEPSTNDAIAMLLALHIKERLCNAKAKPETSERIIEESLKTALFLFEPSGYWSDLLADRALWICKREQPLFGPSGLHRGVCSYARSWRLLDLPIKDLSQVSEGICVSEAEMIEAMLEVLVPQLESSFSCDSDKSRNGKRRESHKQEKNTSIGVGFDEDALAHSMEKVPENTVTNKSKTISSVPVNANSPEHSTTTVSTGVSRKSASENLLSQFSTSKMAKVDLDETFSMLTTSSLSSLRRFADKIKANTSRLSITSIKSKWSGHMSIESWKLENRFSLLA